MPRKPQIEAPQDRVIRAGEQIELQLEEGDDEGTVVKAPYGKLRPL